ncbi:hypothetical protein DFJ77DRAFT_469596 [Powellomyces hirtus]|nr:hypothetical protein DFJ77DRAFT_469596 [Powellomyces hirtus]
MTSIQSLPNALETWVASLDPSPTALARSQVHQGSKSVADSLCKNQLVPIWEYLTTRVTSARRAQRIRAALAKECKNTQALDASPKLRAYRSQIAERTTTEAKLQNRKEALQRALAEAKKQRQHRITECEELTRQAASTACQNVIAKKDIEHKQQKLCIIQAHRRDVARNIQVIRKYSEMLRAFMPKAGQNESRQKSSLQVHAVKIKELCVELEQEIGASAGQRQSAAASESAWKDSKYSNLTAQPEQLWKALSGQMEAALQEVQQDDPSASKKPMNWDDLWVERLEKQLQEAAVTHVNRYKEAQSLIAEAEANDKRFISLINDVEANHGKTASDALRRRCTAFAVRSLAEANSKGVREVEERLSELQQTWAATVEIDRAMRRQSEELIRQYSHFDTMRKDVACTREDLRTCLKEAEAYATTRIADQSKALQHASQNLQGSLYAEHLAFRGVSLWQINNASDDSLKDARMKALVPTSIGTTFHHKVKDLQADLSTPLYQSPENVIRKVIEIRDAASWNRVILQLNDDLAENVQAQLRTLRLNLQIESSADDSESALAETVAELQDYIVYLNDNYEKESIPRANAILAEADTCSQIHRSICQMENDRNQLMAMIQ